MSLSRWRAAPLVLLISLVLVTGCGADDPGSIDPGSRPAAERTEVTHTLEPTAEMRDAARQQCLDDPELDVGYVKAVAPESGAVLAELEVDCEDVRTEE